MDKTTMFAIAALLFAAAAPGFADPDDGAKGLKTLNDAAAALAPMNPDLSGQISQFAQKEATEKPGDEQAEAAGSSDVQLLNRAADALQSARPDLSQSLRAYAADEARSEGKQVPSVDRTGVPDSNRR